ncbi:hypothetical protein C8T65DRAFT_570970, partial [Cerioporus squamosus]
MTASSRRATRKSTQRQDRQRAQADERRSAEESQARTRRQSRESREHSPGSSRRRRVPRQAADENVSLAQVPSPSHHPIHRPTFRVLPQARRPYAEPIQRHDLGRMNVVCPHCGAFHWEAEKLQRSPRSRPEFGICCNSGKVQIASLPDPPPALRELFTGRHAQAVEFRNNIRQYNSTFAFTSLRTDIDDNINNTGGPAPWVFRIHGDLYHRGGTLIAREGERPRYAQLYVYDPRMALEARAHRNSNLRQDTLQLLQNILNEHHQYAPLYRFAYEWLQNCGQPNDAPSEDVTIRLTVDPSRDRRRYNLPTADDVAIILPGQQFTGDYRDILLRTRAGPLQRIHEGHPGYAPLHYPLLFPHGTSGWYRELRQR